MSASRFLFHLASQFPSAAVSPGRNYWTVRVHDAGPGTLYLGGVKITPDGIPDFMPAALERDSLYEGSSFEQAWAKRVVKEIK